MANVRILLLYCLLFPVTLLAVNEDSLRKVCERSGKIDVKAFDKLLGNYAKNDPEELFTWSKKLLGRALKEEDDYAEMLAYSYLGDYYSERGNHNLGLTNLHRSRKFYEAQNASRELVDVYNGIGNVFYRKGEFPEAIKWYLKSMSKGDEIQDVWMMNMAKLNLGRCYLQLNELQKGESTILNYIEQVRRLNKPTSLANAYNVLGGYYQGKGDYDLADHYFNEALVIGLNNGDKRNLAHSYNNLAISYFYQDKAELAKAYFRKALNQRLELDVKMYVAESYYNLGDWFFYQDQYDSAMAYYQWSFEAGKAGESYSAMGDALVAMAEVERARKRFEKAFDYLNEYLEIKERQFSDNSREDLAVLEFDHQMSEEKRLRDSRKQDEVTQAKFTAFETRNKWLVISGVSVLLVTILILIMKIWSDKRNSVSALSQLEKAYATLKDERDDASAAQERRLKKVSDHLIADLPNCALPKSYRILGDAELIKTRLVPMFGGDFFVWDAPLNEVESALFAKYLLTKFSVQVDAEVIDEALESQQLIDCSLIDWIWIDAVGGIKRKSGFDSFIQGQRSLESANELKSGLLIHQQFPIQHQQALIDLENRLLGLTGFSDELLNALVLDLFGDDEILHKHVVVYRDQE